MQTILETNDSKYILLKRIGYGGSCLVFKGYSLNDDSHRMLAIKIYKEHHKKYFDKEILININLSSKYFLSVINYGTGFIYQENNSSLNIIESNNINNYSENLDGKVLYKIEELAENGELFNYIYELNKGFPEKISSKIFSSIIESVKILHQNNVIHGDIKPENILLGNDFVPKLIDFGFSTKFNKKNNNIIFATEGSDIYSSPELRKANINGYDGIKSDIFSLGVLLFVITVGKFPFYLSCYSDKKYRLIINKKFEKYWANFETYNLSNEFKDLINKLVCFDPKERLSIEEILEHPWIKMNGSNIELNKNNEFCIDKDVIEELERRKHYMEKKTN